MNFSRSAWQRVLPFAIFMALLWLRGAAASADIGGLDSRLIYGATVLVVGGLLWFWRQDFGELARKNVPGVGEMALALAVGLAMFVAWIHLTDPWMMLGEPTASFRPVDAQGQRLWPLIAVRWIGATLMVPVMEELFWRSFLMRWIEHPVFEGVDPRRVGAKAVLLSTLLFALAHPQWLAAVLAGLAYAWLYRRSGRLWSAVIAHAVTNGALGVYVVSGGRWEFW